LIVEEKVVIYVFGFDDDSDEGDEGDDDDDHICPWVIKVRVQVWV
jgi:hypothetical protein